MIVPENKNDKLWILLIINNETSSDAQIYVFCAVFFWLVSHNIYAFKQLLKFFLEKNNWFDTSETTEFKGLIGTIIAFLW